MRLWLFIFTGIVSPLFAQYYPPDPYQMAREFVNKGDVIKPAYVFSMFKQSGKDHSNDDLRVGMPAFKVDGWLVFLTYLVTSPSGKTPQEPERRLYRVSFPTFHGGHWSHAQVELTMGTDPEITVLQDRFMKLTNHYDTLRYDSASRSMVSSAKVFTQYVVMDGNDVFRLEEMDSARLRISRSWILAKYGCRFKEKELDSYFFEYRWYVPKFDRVDPLLKEEDKELIALLMKAETALKANK